MKKVIIIMGVISSLVCLLFIFVICNYSILIKNNKELENIIQDKNKLVEEKEISIKSNNENLLELNEEKKEEIEEKIIWEKLKAELNQALS